MLPGLQCLSADAYFWGHLKLLHDMGNCETLLIDGESLCLDAFSAGCPSPLQPLSLVAHAEKLLQQLLQSRAVYRIVFFSGYDAAWAAMPGSEGISAACARAVLQNHLAALPGLQVLEFEGWWSLEFEAYVQQEHPVFCLLSDVCAKSHPRGAPLVEYQAVETLTLGLSLHCLGLATDVAYMSSLQFDHVTAHGFLTAAGACSKQVIKVACSAAKDVQPLLQQCNAAASEVPPCFHHPTHAANLAQSLQQLHSWRLAAGVHACAAVISGSTRESEEEEVLCWMSCIWLLHLALMRAMPLQQRALKPLPQCALRNLAGMVPTNHSAPAAAAAFVPTCLAAMRHQLAALPQVVEATALPAVVEAAGGGVLPVPDVAEAAALQPDAPAAVLPASGVPPAAKGFSPLPSSTGSVTSHNMLSVLRQELVDSWDVKLFDMLLLLLTASYDVSNPLQGLPVCLLQEWQAACNTLAEVLRAQGCTSAAAAAAADAASRVDGSFARPPPVLLTALSEKFDVDQFSLWVHKQQQQQTCGLPARAEKLIEKSAQPPQHSLFISGLLEQCNLSSAAVAPHTSSIGTSRQLQAPATAPLFNVPTAFQDVYHWHSKVELEPAFLAEAADDREKHIKLKKKVWDTPFEAVLQFREIKNYMRRKMDFMATAGESIQARKKWLLDTIEDRHNKREQQNARALQRFIESLQGGKAIRFSAASKSSQGSSGSTKGQVIIQAQTEKKRLENLKEDEQAFRPLEDAMLGLLEQPRAWKDADQIKKMILGPLEVFLHPKTRDRQPEAMQVALGTKVVALYKCLEQQQLQQQASLLGGLVPFGGDASTLLPSTTTKLLANLLLAAQDITAMPADSLLAPILHKYAGWAGPAVPAAAAAAAAAPKEKKGKARKASSGSSGSSKREEKGAGDDVFSLKLLRSSSTTLSVLLAALTGVGWGRLAHQVGLQMCANSRFVSMDDHGSGSSSSSSKQGKESAQGLKQGSKASKQGGSKKGHDDGMAGLAANQVPVSAALKAIAAAVKATKLLPIQIPSSLSAAAPAAPASAPAAGGDDTPDFQPAGTGALSHGLISSPMEDWRCPIRFQLQHLGHLLLRPDNGIADKRVQGFKPDLWQQHLLSIVDAGASAVISAPTSSGKTFIASYVIARVLEDSKDGKVAIVLPTKALVNQLLAQMYHHFGGENVGVFTRDFRQRMNTCRILITVPSCLEILMLSPASGEFVQSMRYLILDEVHCMNERGGGHVWERIMLGMRCPLLALSATIGNPTEFAAWLRRVKEQQRLQDQQAGDVLQTSAHATSLKTSPYAVHLVIHTERYNDLQTSVYVLPLQAQELCPSDLVVHSAPGSRAATLTESNPSLGRMERLHPLASVDLQALAQSTSQDGSAVGMGMMPDEGLALYCAMVEAARGAAEHAAREAGSQGAEEASKMLQQLMALAPEQALAPPGLQAGANKGDNQGHGSSSSSSSSLTALLTRPAAKRWCSMVWVQLEAWCRAGPLWAAAAARVKQQLCRAVEDGKAAYEARHARNQGRDGAHGDEQQLVHIMLLLKALANEDKLPVIVFNFSKSMCGIYAHTLMKQLKNAEQTSRKKHGQQLAEKLAKRQRQVDARAQARSQASKNGQDAEEADRSDPVLAAPFEVIDGILYSLDERPSPSFSFTPLDTGCGNELLEAVENLRPYVPDEGLLEALMRGIGVHHSSLPKEYRQQVESLFRARVLQVVFATGTLAYGIHMPCKTVVMAGDSMFLDALNFRQMSGRAGRRGLDSLGHVIWYHVPLFKIHRVMAAPLPRLRGQFLLLPSLTMRLALLSQGRSAKGAGKKGHRVAEDLMACIIRSSFLRDSIPQGGTGMGMDRLQQQLLHTFCSTVRLLMSSSLMNERGEATGLSGLCSHLFWTEPANFALVALLGSGSLAKLMSSKRDTQSKQNALACVVAHLFERIPIQPNRARRMREEAIETTSSSLVILPKLPKECAQTLSAFNAHVLDTASQCIISFAEALEAQAMQNPGQAAQMQLEDATLPLSGFTHYAPLQQHQQLQQQPHRGADAAPETPRLASLLQPALPVSNTNVWLPAQHSVAACPFACLSGHGDRFCSVAELVGSTKQRICVDASAIPVVDLCDRHGQPYPLNAYVYDFFKHGQPQTITCDNGVLDGDAWESFRSIQGILQAISTSLELIMLDLQKAGGLSGSKDMEMIVTGFKEVLGIFQRKFQAYSSIPPLHGL